MFGNSGVAFIPKLPGWLPEVFMGSIVISPFDKVEVWSILTTLPGINCEVLVFCIILDELLFPKTIINYFWSFSISSNS